MNKVFIYRSLNVGALGIMLTLNYLANALPINGYNTGQLSDMYPNLFVPAEITFAIWGIIYLMLLAFIIFQWTPFAEPFISKYKFLFVINGALNASWIIVWHYRLIELSLIVMLGLLYTLIKMYLINEEIKSKNIGITAFIKWPINIYFAWICVATIANATTLLVDWNWSIPAPVYWTVALIMITQVLQILINSRRPNIMYTLTLIWALYGIVIKRTALDGPDIILYTAYACLGACIGIYLMARLKYKNYN